MRFVNCILNLLSDKSLMLDPELHISELGWNEDDEFVLKIVSGVMILIRKDSNGHSPVRK